MTHVTAHCSPVLLSFTLKALTRAERLNACGIRVLPCSESGKASVGLSVRSDFHMRCRTQETQHRATGSRSPCGWSALALVILHALVLLAPGRLAQAADSDKPKNVLVLYSFSDRNLFDPVENLKSAIRARVNAPVNFYVHYLEVQGLEDPNYDRSLSENLRSELSGVKLDVVITAVYSSYQFALRHRDEIFPGVPVVFSYVHASRVDGKQLPPGVTGVTVSVGIRETLELAFKLHPGTENLAVVAGTSEFERFWRAAVRNQFGAYAEKVKLIEIVGLGNTDILKQVSALPRHTVVLFIVMPKDSSQPEVGVYDTVAAIGQRFPTYCIFENYCLDHGGIGGSFYDYGEQTSKTAEITERILSGEKAENIPVVHDSGTHVNVDWRELVQWNVPESALPSGAIVLFRQPSVWDRYKKYIIVGVAFLFVQTLLIVGLLWQRARKKTATADLRRLGGHLIHAQEEERARLARELHDDFSQRLAVQSIELTQLEKDLPTSQAEPRARTLQLIKETKEMSADMRSLSHQLHSSRLDLVGLVPALSGLCEEITKKYKIDVHFAEHNFPCNLTKEVELCLFRVAQEALANVVKHSEASSAQVELGASRNNVSLRILDTGKGFNPAVKDPASGIGLVGMRERLRLVSGKLSIGSEPMRGTEILAEIPLSSAVAVDQVTVPAEEGMPS